jgi:glycosyltransferase involved in cell wall biosynthesis
VSNRSRDAVNILLVTAGDETIGGVAYVVGNLARHLQSRGHDVIFFHVGNSVIIKSKTTQWGFHSFNLNLQMPFGDRHAATSLLLFCFRFPVVLFQLLRLLQRRRIQIVNIHYAAESYIYFAICRYILPIRLITSVHGADLFPGGIRRDEYPRSIKLLLKVSDLIVAPSNAYRQDVAGVFPELIGRMVFIHNGVDLSELKSVPGTRTSPNGNPFVLCVAMHNEKKGIDVLLRAFAHLHDTRPDLRLVLAGDGPLREQLEDLAASLNLRDKVEFRGRQTRTQVANLLHDCEVFVLPSRSEPFGIVLIEAMACGKPVVATTAGGIPEIVENGKNGLLVQPDDPRALAEALIKVLSDTDLQKTIASNGLSTARKRFRAEDTGAAYESVYAGLLNPSTTRSFQAARTSL